MRDDSYAELGIAKTQARAAEQRMREGPDGVKRHMDYNAGLIKDRIYLFAFALVALLFVGIILAGYPVLAIAGAIICLAAWYAIRIRKNIKREAQRDADASVRKTRN